jgi:hypothetical protein
MASTSSINSAVDTNWCLQSALKQHKGQGTRYSSVRQLKKQAGRVMLSNQGAAQNGAQVLLCSACISGCAYAAL